MAYIGVSPSNGVRKKHTYTATASQTSFSGAGAEGITLAYRDSNYVDVYQNGVKLADEDYTATSGTAIVLAQGASADDIVEIIAFDVFSVADTVSKADGGTFDGNVAMAGTLQVDGAITSSVGATITVADNSDNLTLTSTDADATSGPNLRFYRNSASPADNDGTGQIQFEANNDAGEVVVFNDIQSKITDASDGTEDGTARFRNMVGGTLRDYMLTNGTETVFNDGSVDLDFRVESNGNANMLFVDGGNNAVGIGTATPASSWASANNFVISDTSSDGGMTIISGTSGNGNIMFSDATAGAFSDARGLISYLHASDAMRFHTANTEHMKIHSNGVVAPLNGIALGVGTANTASNVLDDYEEGSFTPAPSSGAIANKTGKYIKVGNLVHITMELSNFSGGQSSANFQVGGIPFTNNGDESVGSNYVDNVNTGTGFPNITTYVYPNNTIFRLFEQGDDNAHNVMTYNAFDTSSKVVVSFTYEIA